VKYFDTKDGLPQKVAIQATSRPARN
jgi:hypothetical protein